MTLKSDLNVGCPIPIDGGCDKRFEPISCGLFVILIDPTGGGGKKPGGAVGANDVTVSCAT